MRINVRHPGQILPVEDNIPATILAAATMTGALISPLAAAGAAALVLAVGATGYFLWKKDFNREAKRLKKRGYIALTKTKKGWVVKITKKGKWRLQQIKIQKMVLPEPKNWDGKWRLVIFDVPEKFVYSRDAMRDNLKRLGFYNFQRSTLAYPHACRNEIEEIMAYYDLDEYCTYLETSFIDIDRELRHHFAL